LPPAIADQLPAESRRPPRGRHASRRAHAAPDDHHSHEQPRIAVLIPAHNEEERIADAIQGMWRQSRPPEIVVVVADNCTDATAEVAARNGAQVFHTHENRHKKAGGLNQALNWLLPYLTDYDLVLVQDADTVLNPEFIATAMATFSRRVGAVGGVFYGEPGGCARSARPGGPGGSAAATTATASRP
jgi:cellulose synthase/poly-beta-1,6-N-acetylglucosamine synthase-like glycosyltransferase